jgi:hypothetical protein
MANYDYFTKSTVYKSRVTEALNKAFSLYAHYDEVRLILWRTCMVLMLYIVRLQRRCSVVGNSFLLRLPGVWRYQPPQPCHRHLEPCVCVVRIPAVMHST